MGGRNNYPDFSNADAFGGPQYFEQLEQWADNLFGESYATPGDLPSGVPDGRVCFVQSNQTLYVASGGAFTPFSGVPQVANVTSFGANYSFGSATSSRITKTGTVVRLNVQLARSVDMQIGNVAFTLPVGFRPYADTYITGTVTNSGNQGFIGWLISAATGAVTLNWYTSVAGHPQAAWLVGSFETL